MADAFSHKDTKDLLWSKHILFLGDSNMRAQYKDLVWLMNTNTLTELTQLRSRLEVSYLGDKLIAGSKLHRGRTYQEVRKYNDDKNKTTLEYMFIPRCYNQHVKELFNNIRSGRRPVPNVVVINSCLWDLTRWGPNGVPEYKDNMVRLMRLMSQSLPKECLVIWTTTLPTAAHVQGGLIIKQIEFMEPLLRFEVMEANTFARDVVVSHGFDVLDNHYHTRMQMHRRAKDGVHYMPVPVRLMTNLLLTHVSLSWGCELPGNINSVLLDKAKAMNCKPSRQTPVKMPTCKIFSRLSPALPKTGGLKITFENNDEPKTARRRCTLQGGSQVPNFKTNHTFPSVELNYEGMSGGYQRRNQGLPEHSVGPYRRNNRKKNNRKNPYFGNQYYHGYY
uniref:Uncharacterized protein n=1 Tax=Graphocephala atropunctata TaxID=36148 RepID=A0A1B6M8Y4_9HEMI